MNNTIVINRKKLTVKMVIMFIAIAAGVALPQIFHAVGTISGTGANLGAALLPMHIPVLLAGFLGGPVVGAVAGLLSPIISFVVSGMPAAAILPFMIIELSVYGLVSGMLSKVKLNSFIKLFVTQIAGRAARAIAMFSVIYIFGNTQLTTASVWSFITAGLFGIILQWAIIPLLSERMEGIKKLYE